MTTHSLPSPMLKNNTILLWAKAFWCLCPIFLVMIFFTQSTSCSRKQIALHYIDTLSVPHNIGYVMSCYSPIEDSQVNTYYYVTESGHAVLNYCIGSILPYSKFEHKNYISNYFLENDSNLVIQFPRERYLIRINNKSEIKDTLKLRMRNKTGESYVMETFNEQYYIPIAKDSGILICRAFLKSESDYCQNINSRIKKFSSPVFHTFVVEDNQINQTSKGIGKYPYAHLQKDIARYHYFGHSTMNKDTDIVKIYPFVDSIFVIHLDGTQERHFFHSKYQKHENEAFNASVYDFDGINRHLCMQTSYSYIIYDSYRNCYYIAVSKPISPENTDGTRNLSEDRPWSLIVLDNKFNQLGEIDMPEQFSKHELMIVPDGLAIKDNSLKKGNENIFVICDIY